MKDWGGGCAGLPASSSAVTQGVRVEVQARYVPEESAPLERQFFFVYRVRISNLAAEAVRLESRHWIIVDGRGREEHVRGAGVIGEQPRLEPGGAFEYSSFCPLRTPNGSMRGTYRMVRDDGSCFDATVAGFSLLAPQLLN